MATDPNTRNHDPNARSRLTPPETLTSLGFNPPAWWQTASAGERLDFLQRILDAANRAYRRIDEHSFHETRDEHDQNNRRYAVTGD